MTKRLRGNILATTVAAIVGLGAMYASATRLKPPEDFFDWVVLIFSGLTTGTLAFFVIWGHFQEIPAPAPPTNTP